MRQLLECIPGHELLIKALWPGGLRYAFVLTHDVETRAGQAFIHRVPALEESFGFRSSFNFVPERYAVDKGLVDELRRRGFEIGLHGLKRDDWLFSSRAEFDRRALKINRYLKDFSAVGFRSPLTHRNPEWMQALDIEYDLSFFGYRSVRTNPWRDDEHMAFFHRPFHRIAIHARSRLHLDIGPW